MAVNSSHAVPPRHDSSDEELMLQLAHGHQEALGPLYSRYGPIIFNIAAHSLDRAAAEEIVQDVFLTVWRNAAVFTPDRGAFRPWVLQIAHFRVLNELRRRSRRPQLESDPDGLLVARLPDQGPEPEEVAWRDSLRSTVHAAFEELPPAQRQALDLAFFKDLSHEQVAAKLRIPLGTAKTRIRAGLGKLRGKLAPVMAGLALVGIIATLGVRYQAEQAMRQRDERALSLLTSSTTEVIRLVPAPGEPAAEHGQYRGQAGAHIAVVTLSNFPAAPAGKTYQAWILHKGVWTSLGTAQPDAGGRARLIAESPDLAVLPEAIQVTLEPMGGSRSPTGPVMILWPGR
jgi:RNA polymerase sigma-70 factor, ECF subfamily